MGMLKAEPGVFDGELDCRNNACGEGVNPDDFYYAHRPASESYTVELTKEQYNFIGKKYEEYSELEVKPIYSLIPDPDIPEHRNCTMFVRDLMLDAGIDTFQYVRTPEDIKYTIGALDRGEPAPTPEELANFAVANYDEHLRGLINYANEHQEDIGERVSSLKDIYDQFSNAESMKEKIDIIRGDELKDNVDALKDHALTMNNEFNVTDIAAAYAAEQLADLRDLAVDKVKGLHEQAVNKLTDGIEAAVDTVQTVHQQGVELGVDAIEATVNLHGQAVNTLTDGIEVAVDTVQELHQKGVELGVDAIEATVNLHGQAVNALTDGIEVAVDTVQELHQKGVELGTDAIEATVNTLSEAGDYLQAKGSEAKDYVFGKADELSESVSQGVDNIKQFFSGKEAPEPEQEVSVNEQGFVPMGSAFLDELLLCVNDPEKFDQCMNKVVDTDTGKEMTAQMDQMLQALQGKERTQELTQQQERDIEEQGRSKGMDMSR